MIEASDDATMGRYRSIILDHHRGADEASFAYDWRSKNERLLWVADAIAGAVDDYVTGRNSEWFATLESANVIELVNRQI